MKKSGRAFFMTALVCGVAGAAFCIAGLCFDFRMEELRAKAESGELQVVAPEGWKEHVEELVDDLDSDTVDFEKTYTGIRTLELDLGSTACTIIPSEGNTWKIKGFQLPTSFRALQSNDTLSIDGTARGWRFWNWNRHTPSGRIELYIPQDILLDKLDIENGVGDLQMEEGYLKCRTLEMDCGVGSSELSLDIQKKAKISCGVGNAELSLLGMEEDFDYEFEYGVGSVSINGHSRSGIGGSEKIDHHASKTIEIDCGVGDVSIDFFDE